jgi:hypothetical protein
VLAVLEPCLSFQVVGNRKSQKLEVIRARRKCLHFYFYLMDPEFGFMHVRIQSWFPFQIQIYINGRSYLARQMDKRGLSYQPYENSFLKVEDLVALESMSEKLLRINWPRVLNAFARRVNPLLAVIRKAGFGGYYWVLDQMEIATDIMFTSRAELMALLPDLRDHALRMFSCDDVMRFLGRKPHGGFQGEVGSDLKKRPEGYRVKFRLKGNSLKMYDKWSVLRVETTICRPQEFKVPRFTGKGKQRKLRWCAMAKGVVNIRRFLEVGQQSNQRYLEALGQASLKGKAMKQLDGLCKPVMRNGKQFAKVQPLSNTERELFRAVLSGEHLIHGVRNQDVRAVLFDSPASSSQEEKRRCAKVSRLLRKLWAHGLIYRVYKANLYRVTHKGHRIMSAVLSFYQSGFPEAYSMAS